MDLRQLEYFLAVVEERSFTRAALRTHAVQSTISASIRSLERELGAQLFERTTRTVQITDAGLALVDHARAVLAAAEAATESVRAATGAVTGTVRLGVMHALMPMAFAAALAEFHQERPGVQIRARTDPAGSRGLVAAVRAGDVDLAIAAASTAELEGLESVLLRSEEMVLISAPGSESASTAAVPLGELAGRTFIDVPVGWGSRTATDALLLAHGVARDVSIEVGDASTVVDLVRAGLGSAVVAPSSVQGLSRVSVTALDPAPVLDVRLVHARGRLRAAAALLLERVLQAHPGST